EEAREIGDKREHCSSGTPVDKPVACPPREFATAPISRDSSGSDGNAGAAARRARPGLARGRRLKTQTRTSAPRYPQRGRGQALDERFGQAEETRQIGDKREHCSSGTIVDKPVACPPREFATAPISRDSSGSAGKAGAATRRARPGLARGRRLKTQTRT